MANIKNMQMWNTICADARVSISKTLFGLRTTAVYTPSNSIIDARSLEFSGPDGERLRRLLSTAEDTHGDALAKAIGDFRPQAISNGNYMAELCTSRDGAFLAVQLFQFQRLNYEPVSPVLIAEGDDARAVALLF